MSKHFRLIALSRSRKSQNVVESRRCLNRMSLICVVTIFKMYVKNKQRSKFIIMASAQ